MGVQSGLVRRLLRNISNSDLLLNPSICFLIHGRQIRHVGRQRKTYTPEEHVCLHWTFGLSVEMAVGSLFIYGLAY